MNLFYYFVTQILGEYTASKLLFLKKIHETTINKMHSKINRTQSFMGDLPAATGITVYKQAILPQ
jgi:hypothetical protein